MSEEHSIDKDERELARLYGKLPRAVPPAELDEAVLRRAREALPAGDAATTASGKVRAPRRGLRWAGALAAVASLVLVANLAWQQRQLPARAVRSEAVTDKVQTPPPLAVGGTSSVTDASVPAQAAPAAPAVDEAVARKASTTKPGRVAMAYNQARKSAPAAGYPAPAQDRAARGASEEEEKAPPGAGPRLAVLPPPPAEAPQELAASAAPPVELQQTLQAASTVGAAEPQRRVATIRRMLRDGHEAAARKALAELRQDFPGFVVPRDLAPLAK
jgi:hypothetical protein